MKRPRTTPLGALGAALLLACCSTDPGPTHVSGGTSKTSADASQDQESEEPGPQGTRFVDAAPASAAGDEIPEDVGALLGVGNSNPPGALDPSIVAGLDPNQAKALIMDPGKTARGSIPNLVTFADLSLVGVDIDELADYMYEHESENAKNFRFPERARTQQGEDKAIVGYMIALEMKPRSRDVLEFMLVKDLLSCCYGQLPRPDEWVYVKMKNDEAVKYHTYRPIVVRGDFKVGRIDDELGYSWGVYEMEADSVEIFTPPKPQTPSKPQAPSGK